MVTKSQLAIQLSKLKVFEDPSIREEQYPMDSEIGAEVLWFASQQWDIDGKVVADLGCGTGILGIGALLLGARKVYFIDNDSKALEIAKENVGTLKFKGEAEFLNIDVKDFDKKVDVVIQNPPFGTKVKHADKPFLEKAFEVGKVVYSFHKAVSKNFVEAVSKDGGFSVTHYFEFDFPLKNVYSMHTREIHRIKVGCWRMVRE